MRGARGTRRVADTILYVDDAPALPAGAADALLRVGYRLVHTADPDTALRMARRQAPRILLLEVLLPSCDGLRLIERIRSWEEPAGRVPILILTRGERSPELYGRALELGVTDFLCKPVLAAELLAAVLECGERRSQADPSDPPGRPSAIEFSGDLAESPLPELLHRLHRLGATGVLILQHEAEGREIQLRNGSPIAVASNRGSETLEDFLVRTKRISGAEHEALVERLEAGLGSSREILVAMGALGEAELEAAIGQRAREPVLEGFSWLCGNYCFEPGKKLEPGARLDLDQSPARLLFEGVLQWAPTEMIRELIQRRARFYLSRVERPSYRFDELGPEARAPEALEGLLGDRSVAEVLASGEIAERVLYGLLVTRFIEVHPDPVLLLREALTPIPPARAAAPPERLRPAPVPSQAAEGAGAGSVESELSRLASRISSQDDFAVLGVEPDASDGEVRDAYELLLGIVPRTDASVEGSGIADLARKVRDRIEKAYARLRDADSRHAFAALRREGQKTRAAEARASRQLEAESWFRKGEDSLRRKRYSEAAEAFGMAAHLDPNAGEYRAHLGYALHLDNPLNELIRREALEHIAKGIKLSPDREKPLLFLGRVFKAAGELENARKLFRRVLKIKPDCDDARRELRQLTVPTPTRKSFLDRLLGR